MSPENLPMLNERSWENYENYTDYTGCIEIFTVTKSLFDTKLNSTLAASPISGSLVIIV